MCNQEILQGLKNHRLKEQENQEETFPLMMTIDSPAALFSSDESPRVKFLVSFGGSIMPRPQDGKLRYVGGETRIVSLPRDINFDELMSKMRELFEAAVVLKYQQPDEDLDALVSVVNDDDVVNMMEEYDKLGVGGDGGGFTRLRMFLFPNIEQDCSFSSSSPHFDSAERDTERRYVDALNSLNDASELFRVGQSPESPVMGAVAQESLINPVNVEFGLHNQRNCEVPLPQFNLRHLRIPHLGSGQLQQQQPQQTNTQRYSEMEAPWSPAYYSPRHHGHHDTRHVTEFPASPSSGRYRVPFGEFPDRCTAEEYGRQSFSHQPQPQYDNQSPFVDNVVWLPAPAVPNDSGGFPVNLGHSHNAFEGNNSSICEHCRITFQRNPTLMDASRYADPRWMPAAQSHLEPQNTGNDFHQFGSPPCAECNHRREAYALNPDVNLETGVYSKEQNDPRNFYNEFHNHERQWAAHHHLNYRAEEPRSNISGGGWINEQYLIDGTNMAGPTAQGNCRHQVLPNCVNHEDPRYIRTGPELGKEGYHEHAVGHGQQIQISPLDDPGVRYGNFPSAYGTDSAYQVPHGIAPAHAVWSKMQNPMRASPSYEALNMLHQTNGTVNLGFQRSSPGSPSYRVGMDNSNPWAGNSQKMFGFDGPAAPECPQPSAPRFNSNTLGQDNQPPLGRDSIGTQHSIPVERMPKMSSSSQATNDFVQVLTTPNHNPGPSDDTDATGTTGLEDKSMLGDCQEAKCVKPTEDSNVLNNPPLDKDDLVDLKSKESGFESNCQKPSGDGSNSIELSIIDGIYSYEQAGFSVQRLSFLPELIASVKKAALEGAEEVKVRAQANGENDVDFASKEAAARELDAENTHGDVEVDSDSENPEVSGIEQTKAEEEALSRGLQTIKNDDLEEIRELGSGTYGAVYYGKWKGSDVAIKRIKASCFAGRPSERERLIADFWKEALILSSLHHPNVVSFYGIVRDGPDRSLATVTEFMVNGSLKQFLQKKDRTIDRRKRLLIAMDAAFGMEYLHAKNIVHFDLKCENLLVNMRDPHRPICKIGDLGLSKVKQHTLVSGGVRGTLPWMAPELLSGKSNMVSEKIDVYSFGIVMWELLTGEEPYADMHCASIIGGIVHDSLRPQVPSWCDPEWKSLMESSWASDPGERPSFSEISQKLRKMAAAINLK
ncbi:Mitogen-activated protein kinase kinase kinase [Thalictrum thalictroides]|uniref:Mitogen-activated protein kinase kinase kinase n=1 Tax=Thalictrum thalictroides TaxID=46969 RepID=A0A7J6XAR2_THATH|nr:Mitogen-activated protein kinase kinase kinase [Thalictrum thalictroides]